MPAEPPPPPETPPGGPSKAPAEQERPARDAGRIITWLGAGAVMATASGWAMDHEITTFGDLLPAGTSGTTPGGPSAAC